ncbi:MAG: DNA ligase [Desulfobulbaceae bacterium]|nr:DNA ligase [Desulfobulbaceae bacterium]
MWRRFFVITLALGLLLRGCPGVCATEAEKRPDLLLAGVYGWDERQNPSDYWVSEKYDGVRATWDGERLRFRSGRLVAAPRWFVEGLPLCALDGELWLGRQGFARLAGIVKKKVPVDDEWRQVRFMVFELPGAEGTFTERIEQLRRRIDAAGLPWLKMVEQFRVADNKELRQRLDETVRLGGEGLMLHRAEALYHGGRSQDLLKVKQWLDSEARVIAYRSGSGKFEGVLGALEVETSEGRRFFLGTGFSAAERRQPPALGSTVTYRYTGLTASGLPRFPAFVRVRQEF